MTDVHNKSTRSRNMAAIKSKNTKPELWLRKRLHSQGFRYRLNQKDLPGKPDIVLPKYKAVIFINGCFWHMHSCDAFVLPKTRTEWWHEKLDASRKRDLVKQDDLIKSGWRVLVVWECAIKGKSRIPEDDLMASVREWLLYGANFAELPADSVQI